MEKENDKLNAADKKCIVFCMDAQAVKLCPQLNTTASYYKMKLQVHNFTIYNLATHQSSNYFWDETEGGLESSVFATIIIKHLTKVLVSDNNVPIIIYSDGCGYQNRNLILSNALLNLAVKLGVVIKQKFLEKGHTQMECDSTHSLIERKTKGRNIYLPSEFITLAKETRKSPFPLDVRQLTHDYFLNFNEKNLITYSSIRPGRKTSDPTVNDLRSLKYAPDGKIYFKLNFDGDYEDLPHRRRRKAGNIIDNAKRLYSKRIPIQRKKWQHLQDLKKYLPADTHSFYDLIEFVDN